MKPWLKRCNKAQIDIINSSKSRAGLRCRKSLSSRRADRAPSCFRTTSDQFLEREILKRRRPHAAGLVHRDLKPGNVIVATLGGQRDVAKLLDLGLVQDLSADAEDRLTRAGTVLGTPAYMSPEQAAGESAVDSRGDIYGLGAVAFFALAGWPPFQGKSVGQVLAAHRSERPPPLTDFRPDAPADLAAVVARCLAKKPHDRFQSAG